MSTEEDSTLSAAVGASDESIDNSTTAYDSTELINDPSSDWASVHDRNRMFSSVSLSSALMQSYNVDSNFMPASSMASPENLQAGNGPSLSPLCRELLDLIPDLSFMLR